MDLRSEELALIYGGRCDHELSVKTAEKLSSALKEMRINTNLIKIFRNGEWRFFGLASKPEINAFNLKDFGGKKLGITWDEGHLKFISKENNTLYLEPTVIFPLLHTIYREDGSVQGLLEYANLPYIGSRVLALLFAHLKTMLN